MGYIRWDSTNTSFSLSSDGLTASKTATGHIGVRATQGVNRGKWYWEAKVITRGSRIAFGYSKESQGMGGMISFNGNDDIRVASGNEKTSPRSSFGDTLFDSGDIVGVALDLEKKQLSFYKNGEYMGVAFSGNDPVSGLDEDVLWFPYSTGWRSNESTVNFGATEFDIATSNPDAWEELVEEGYVPYDVDNADWFSSIFF